MTQSMAQSISKSIARSTTRVIARQVSLFISFCLLALLLNGCGFKLRGNYLLAPELQTLEFSSVDKFGELTRIVKRNLTINDVKIVPHSDQPLSLIHI